MMLHRAGTALHGRGAHARKQLEALRVYGATVDHPGAVYKKGDLIGNVYEVLGVLGVGGFSIVYLVYSHETESAYALKTLRDEFLEEPETREQFRKEAKMWVDLERHPYLVRAHFIEELTGRLYIGMEYIEPNAEGVNSLEGYLKRSTPDLVQTLRWAIQFCHGMEYARSKGIRCHRDVKPSNIMLTREGIIKITDFGFADVIDRTRTRSMMNILSRRKRAISDWSGFGTPTYMPPEQFHNAVRCDERSDIYSFGVVLYQLASRGRLPFTPTERIKTWGDDTPRVWKEMHRLHTEAPVPPLPSVLSPAILRCLQKEPSKRFQTFLDLRHDLDDLLRQETGETVIADQSGQLEAWELYNKAFSLSSLGHLEEATRQYEKVLELEPDNANAWNNMGVCYRKLSRPEDALQCYEKSIKADRFSAAAWGNKGNCLYTLGRYPEALIALNRALDIDPLNESAWLNKALVEERLGLRAEAATSYRTFIDLKPVQYAGHVDYARGRLAELEKSQLRS